MRSPIVISLIFSKIKMNLNLLNQQIVIKHLVCSTVPDITKYEKTWDSPLSSNNLKIQLEFR